MSKQEVRVNKFFMDKLSAISAGEYSESFKELAKRAVILSSIGIDNEAKLKRYFVIKSAARDIGAKISDYEIKKIINFDIKSKNDAYYKIVESKINKSGIKKLAYPNPGRTGEVIGEEFDLGKWLKVVHHIYNAVESNEMTKQNALDYYSNFLNIDEDEDIKFKKWFEYYSSGEHLKYSSEEEQNMKKKAIYLGDLGQGNNPYYAGSGSAYLDKNTGNNMPGDSFGDITFDRAAVSAVGAAEDSRQFGAWKTRLHGAIRRIDKLLRSDEYIKADEYRVLAEHLLNLSIQVHQLKLGATLSDVTHKAAGTLNKHGHVNAADILTKIAQEIPEEQGLPSEQALMPPEGQAEEEASIPGALEEGVVPENSALPEEPETDPNDPKNMIPKSDDVDPASLEDITPIPGAQPGEYEALAGDISLEDAAKKLDEVAGMLADRRIIRQLAEFDIMLDKIGIASMFPELAESQSKLIDAFSYALTRVTKMMGQLSNAKALANAQSTNIPGALEETLQAEEPEPVLEDSGDVIEPPVE